MKNVKITFTDEFLSTFTGTQEDLDAIVEELTARFQNGEFDFDQEEVNDFEEEEEFSSDFAQPAKRILH